MGLCLRRVVLQYPRLGRQGSTGISGSFQSESVATFDQNRWQGSTGISGNFRPEYALGLTPTRGVPSRPYTDGMLTMPGNAPNFMGVLIALRPDGSRPLSPERHR